MRYLRLLVLMGGILVSFYAANAAGNPSVEPSYFPLSYGNEWVYTLYSNILDSVLRLDTIRIDGVVREGGQLYYHLSTPWFPIGSVWTRPDTLGDLYWCNSPGQQEQPLLLFSAEPGSGWLLGGRHCMDSTVRVFCPPQIQEGMKSSADVSCFAGAWRPGDCRDAYWFGAVKKNAGPIVWTLSGAGGAALTWELAEFRPGRPCECKCHADPLCDGALDLRDIVIAIDVAFRGMAPTTAHGCWCYAHALHGRTDVDCSGTTDILDVMLVIDAVFGEADPSVAFCHPGES